MRDTVDPEADGRVNAGAGSPGFGGPASNVAANKKPVVASLTILIISLTSVH